PSLLRSLVASQGDHPCQAEHDPRWRAERQKASERHQKMPRGRLGHTEAKHSLGGARLVRPSHPQLHTLAYTDLTRTCDPETRLCLSCGVPSGASSAENENPAEHGQMGGVSGTPMYGFGVIVGGLR